VTPVFDIDRFGIDVSGMSLTCACLIRVSDAAVFDDPTNPGL